jgi:hypothetical protein
MERLIKRLVTVEAKIVASPQGFSLAFGSLPPCCVGVRYAQEETDSAFLSSEANVFRSSCLLKHHQGIFEVGRHTLLRPDSGANTSEFVKPQHNSSQKFVYFCQRQDGGGK